MLNNCNISKVMSGSKWLVLSLAALVLLTPATPRIAAQQAKPLRVLLFSGLNNHDWAATTPVLKKLFEGCDRFGVVDVTGDPSKMDATTFAQYDVIVDNWTPYPETKRTWPAATEKAFLDYIEGGGGLVVFHAASCSFQVWPEFQKLVALTWKADHTAHGAYHTYKVTVEDPTHPIARGLTDFYTTDELYHNMVQVVEQPLNVVFKAFSAREQGGTGKCEPVLVWTKRGKGRGVNLVLGHDDAAMQTGFRTLMLRSAEWAATGAVTLPPPALWPSTSVAMEASRIDVEITLKAVAGYQYGGERKPLRDLQQRVIYASSVTDDPTVSNVRKELAKKIAATLAAPNTSSPAKEFLCKQIAVIGAEDQVPGLAALLADKDVSQWARSALEQIPGPAVDQALREALPRLGGAAKIGIVNTLGERRDAQAVRDLIPLLGGADAGLAGAAADALGKIGGDGSADALKDALSRTSGAVRMCVVNAYLMCAEQWLAQGRKSDAATIYAQLAEPSESPRTRMAALRGRIVTDKENAMVVLTRALVGEDSALQSMAIQLVPEVADETATATLAKLLPQTSEPVQALLLNALAVRGDKSALEAVTGAAHSQDPAVRVAALKALGRLGDASTLNLLAERIVRGAEGAEREAARASLAALPDPEVNTAILKLMASADTELNVGLIGALISRNATDKVGDLLNATENPDLKISKEAWKGLGELARERDVPSLLDRLTQVGDPQLAAAEAALVAVLHNSPQAGKAIAPVLAKLDVATDSPVQAMLLRVVSAIGNDSGLPAVRKALGSDNADVRDAAVRALSAWPTASASAFDDLMNLVRTTPNNLHRILALRGVIRLSSEVQGKTPEKMTDLIAEMMRMAGQPNEKKALLGGLGKCPTLEAMQLALAQMKDPNLAAEAALAVAQIAPVLKDSHRAEVKAAMQQLLATSHDPDIIALADKTLKEVVRPVNLALGATASSPDDLGPDGASGGDQAAIDGDPRTYWDEVDGQDLYRLRVTFKQPTDVSAINILGHPYEIHQAKNFDILCDDNLVKSVRGAKYIKNDLFVTFPATRCTALELKIQGKNGLVSPAIHELQIYNMSDSGQAAPARLAPLPKEPKFRWQETGSTFALLNHDRVVWQLNHGKDLAKIFFHPVALIDGTILTMPCPPDHPWHRALWFSWKMLNGVNYWEEDVATGKAQGMTELVTAKVTPRPDMSARIEMDLGYHPPNVPPVMTEKRLIEVSTPNAEGLYHIDWCGTFKAGDKDVLLEGGTAGGGYAGMSARLAATTGDWQLTDSEGRLDMPTDHLARNKLGIAENTHGQRARWMDYTLIDKATGQPGGIAILGHPENLRHPSQWHNVMMASIPFGYFSPAMLWSQPYTLSAGKSFTLRYRIVVHPGRTDKAMIESQFKELRQWRETAAD